MDIKVFTLIIVKRLVRARLQKSRKSKNAEVFQYIKTLYLLEPWTLRGLKAFWSRFN